MQNEFRINLGLRSMGVDVFRLQDLLETFGYGDFVPTGYFGQKTHEALIKFQYRNGILSTGYFGETTRAFINNILKNRGEVFYFTAIGCLGTDASPYDFAPDEYGCAETVNQIHYKAFGSEIGGNLSTHHMYKALQNTGAFMPVDQPKRGDVIISPTGYGNGTLPNGHVGIMASDTLIMSNNSFNGSFEQNYTVEAWRNRYQKRGGYPVVFFRKI